MNYLFKNTDLQISYNFNMVAIDHKCPKHVGLKKILESYLEHQRIVVTKRTEFDLNKAKERKHIVDGLIKALSILDDVIKTIRASKIKRMQKPTWFHRLILPKSRLRPSFPCSFIV